MFLSNQYSESVASENSCLISNTQHTTRFHLNQQPTYGIYNRNDYMARCYRRCWKMNSRLGPELKKLLCFGGQSSLSGDCCSTFFFIVIVLFPLLSFGLLIPNHSLSPTAKVSICVSMTVILTCFSVWHFYSIMVILKNKQKWLESWFTFNVTEEKLLPTTQQLSTRFFDIRKHMKFFDVTRDSLGHFPLLGKQQKQGLHKKFNTSNMSRARIILFTTRYLDSSVRTTLQITITILVMTVICTGLSLFELVAAASKL